MSFDSLVRLETHFMDAFYSFPIKMWPDRTVECAIEFLSLLTILTRFFFLKKETPNL